MKIHGKVMELRVRESKVTINGVEHTFKLGAVPISFTIALSSVLPPPVPKFEKRAARDEKTGKPLKDPVTRKPFHRALTDESSYQRAQAEHGVMVMIYTLYTSLKSGDAKQLEFDIEAEYARDNKPHDLAFVQAIERELSLNGFDLNTVVGLCTEAQALNSFGNIAEVLKADFSSSSPAAKTTSESQSSSEIKTSDEASSTGCLEPVNSLDSIQPKSMTSLTNGEGV